jgi:uncharacterized membrane protein YvbJ
MNEVKSQDNPVMQDRSWNLTRRSFEPPIQPVQQKKETQEIGKQIDRYTIINKIESIKVMAIIVIVIFIFAIMLDLKKNRQFSTPASGVMNFRQ